MKKIVGFAGITLFLLVCSALVVPSFINWNKYKTEIENTASNLSNRKVSISGDLFLSILPSPSFSAEEVSVSNIEGGQATNIISLKSVDVNVAFLPLLRGEIQVKKFILIEPIVALEIDKSGKENWNFGAQGGTQEKESSYTDLSFEKFQIENGKLSYQDFSKEGEETLSSINASVIMDSLKGPFKIIGNARYKNLPVSTELMIGTVREGRKIPIGLVLGLLDNDVRIKFNGGFLPAAISTQADGKFTLEANDIGDLFRTTSLLDLENQNLNKLSYNQPLSFESTVVYGGDAINISAFEFEMGESRGSGDMTATFGERVRFDGRLLVNSFDLDSFLPVLQGNEEVDLASKNKQSFDYSFMEQLEGNFKFNLGALKYNDKIASQLELDLTTLNGEVDFTNIRLNLPGGSILGMNGTFSAAENKPLFGGNTTFNSGNFRAFLDWLKVDASDIPVGRLTRLSYQGAVRASPDLLQFYGMKGNLDTFQFSGGISYAIQNRTSMGLDVQIEKLNLDNYYLPHSNKELAFKQAISMLAKFDANYKINLIDLTSGGIKIKKVAVSGELLGGNLNAKTINIENYAGFDFNGSLIGNELGSNEYFETYFNTTAASLVPLQRAFRFKIPYNISKIGAVSVNARITGNFKKLNLDLKSTIGNSKADIKGEIRGLALKELSAFGSTDLTIVASNSSLASLINQFDLPLLKATAGYDGPVALTARVKGTKNQLDIDSTLDVAGANILLNGYTNLVKNKVQNYDLTVNIQGPNINNFINGFGGDFIHLNKEIGALALSMKASGNMVDICFNNIVGMAGPTKFSGAGELIGLRETLKYDQKRTFNFTLMFEEVPLADFLTSPTDLLEQKQWGNWSKVPLDLALLHEYNGQINLVADNISYHDFDFEKSHLEIVLKEGTLKVNNFTGQLFGGDVAIMGSYSSLGDLSMDMSLKNAIIIDTTRTFAGISPITGYFDIKQKIMGKGNDQSTIISSLNGTGELTTSLGNINGINIPELSKGINTLDKKNDIFSLLNSSLSDGQTGYDGATTSFTIKNGIIQFLPFNINMRGARSDINLSINLAQWIADLAGDMTLSEHPGSPSIDFRIFGALHNPKATYNTKKLQAFMDQKIAASLLQNMVEGNGGIGNLFGENISPAVGVPQISGEPDGRVKSMPVTNQNKIFSNPLEGSINLKSDPSNTSKLENKIDPVKEEDSETLEELGAKLLDRLLQNPSSAKN
tara:strand:+ start:65348 stop:69007 length:3660 start_codon:yes stop_codon:yes gene_type:complete